MDDQQEVTSCDKTQEKRRKRIRRLKRLIIIGVVLLLVLPTICCFIFMFRLNQMQRQVDHLQKLYSDNYEEYTKYMKGKDNGMAAEEENVLNKTKTPSEQETLEGKKVYLTFDDGPSMYTEEILNILKENDVKATFFVIGKTDDYSKQMYNKIIEEGHTLAMHSYSHQYSSIYS